MRCVAQSVLAYLLVVSAFNCFAEETGPLSVLSEEAAKIHIVKLKSHFRDGLIVRVKGKSGELLEATIKGGLATMAAADGAFLEMPLHIVILEGDKIIAEQTTGTAFLEAGSMAEATIIFTEAGQYRGISVGGNKGNGQ